MTEYVFGYGSLAARGGWTCELRGHRRRWGVAMDNSRTIAGYKYYVDAPTGERPSVFVAFLDVQAADDGDAVNGVAVPAYPEELASLDRRERNYTRTDVTDAVEPRPGPGRVWTYAGSAEARGRRDRGLDEGSLVVSAEYAALVAECFTRLGADEAARYRASTDDPPCPLADLRRIDLPPA